MADRYFGFTCDPVRDEPHLTLVRIDGCELLEHFHTTRRMHRTGPHVSSNQTWKETANRATRTFGIVVPKKRAASICLDLLRRGVKPWADPRRRRAA